MSAALGLATIHRLGVGPVVDGNNNGDDEAAEERAAFAMVPRGERLAALEQIVQGARREFRAELKRVADKLDREVHDLRYDFTRMEGHQEEILRQSAANKQELSNQIAELAGMWRDQQTRGKVFASFFRWIERVVTWIVAAAGWYYAHLMQTGEPPHGPHNP